MEKKQKTDKKNIDKEAEINYDDIVFEKNEDVADITSVDIIKKFREKLKKCIEEKQEYLDGWQRIKADFINNKKKEEESRALLVLFAKEGLILDLLTTIDNFDMAFANKNVWESVDKNWRIGIEHIYSQLLGILENHGLKQFNPLEEEFDPIRHDSVETIAVIKKDDDNKVIDVMGKGYIFNDKVIRAAKVKVGKYEQNKKED
ncbi:nucleotide exchange factor GrpE [Candidatus Campbellbacteria bacterium CG10_big_fil_rev_8_21_14_0_10_35_52]|uniref:Protein GrpE n=1 Tax=Candidatus Campbellbacteria bacterium CG10_big_fil_rev_8_21_14_0_10_35_52 TaxID=1974527 RepID=A0A2M6WVD6_9BACT|nr:MAG: nucleotide exchange factor GrpE [Candidatus Campbellbacteria bacterium CG10_big_fil_rev_8_21_14_0_10_35_52]